MKTTQTVVKIKSEKKDLGSRGVWSHDLCDTDAAFHQLSENKAGKMAFLYSFFHCSSHDFFIFTVLTIIAAAITTTAIYFPLHLDSTS